MPESGRAISPVPARPRGQPAVGPLTHSSSPSLGSEDGIPRSELDTIGDGLQIREATWEAVTTPVLHSGPEQEAWPPESVLAAAPGQARAAVNGAAIAPLRQPADIVAFPQGAARAPATTKPEQTGTTTAPDHHRQQGLAARGLTVLRDPRLKRAIDIAGSLALLGALTPVIGACAAAVRLSSPGPVLFRQKRIGRHGEPFEMLKFRTMHQNADQSAHQQYVAKLIAGTADAHDADGAAVFKIVGDRRITPVGHWMRRLSLDELPQLFNVLRGDMSLVGPRPPLPYEVEHYTPRHLRRLAVTPGITGLWQVSGRSRTTFEEMIDLDLSYIERWSVSLDLQILLRTIPVVVFPDGL